jgi:hypothetical protein
VVDLRSAASLRRLAGRALVGGLCVAAAVALFALFTGKLSDIDWRVVGTSVSFGIFSSTSAAGASLRLRAASWARVLGLFTVAASTSAFALLMFGLWIDFDGDGPWQAWGIAALLTLWGAHASLILRPLRPTDSPAIRSLSVVAVAALGIDTAFAVLGVLGAFDDLDAVVGRLLVAVLIIALLCTALVPILRRLAPAVEAPSTPAEVAFGRSPALHPATVLSREIDAVAARLEALAAAPEMRQEIMRLRELAREAEARS